MRVLSLKEPAASLVKNNTKKIETRSWKTNYRGELYIHASKSKIKLKEIRNKEVLDYIDIENIEYGAIIAKCKLVDCVYMDQEFIDKIKKNDIEYKCGLYEMGRYAWILSDIEPIDEPIYAKGQLGIWYYNK